MKLTKTEKRVLHLLAWGHGYGGALEQINAERRAKSMHPMTKETFHSVCWHIRTKTGIKSTKNVEECRNWERNNHFTLFQKERGPTPQQLRMLHLLAEGKTYPEICSLLKISNQAAMNLASEARKRMKYVDTSRASIREYLLEMAKRGVYRPDAAPEPPKDPMDDPCF